MDGIDKHKFPQVVNQQVSADGARKYVLELEDGALVETVGIPHGDLAAPDKLTVCYSTQVGCAMECAFCATGRQGLTRNLTATEMIQQVSLVAHDFQRHVDSAIAMGQGEPFANYNALREALEFMGSPEGLGIDAHELIVSTCGIPSGIRALADDGLPVALAVSLHAAKQELRNELMPGVRSFPLNRLHTELARYNEITSKPVVVQYLMLDGVNDRDEDREALEAFCSGLDARVSLLQYNRTEGIPFSPSSYGRAVVWSLELNAHGIPASVNKPRGADIHAACGQLVAHA
ncbi:MAG: 23S rRNA (adenine(2503)-C(2))-methyltransferase RlmN [Coriobacteriales bacterium]|nr:23S rRNA (adenine(2503)-C(2))-methyltransferase RlmN [Coriobacteriales bacterium]